MRFQLLSSKELTKKCNGPLIAVVSLAAWKEKNWQKALPAAVRKRVEKASGRLKEPLHEGSELHVAALNDGEEDVLVMILPEEKEKFFLLELARGAVKKVLGKQTKQIALLFADDEQEVALADAFGSALAACAFLMPVFGKREEKQKPWQLRDVYLVSSSDGALSALGRGAILGEGSNLARYLATLPPNVLNSAHYGERIRKLCRENGLKLKFHSNKELKRMGAGAFTAVDQGDPASAGGIYEISYEPRGAKGKKPITLVGKGLCFDTGGYDVKTGGGMLTMKGDMQGSAVALASIVAAAKLKLSRPMKAYLAVTENHLSPKAYKADEVITALNGLTIEVVNTDAEGRMVLADTLTLASRDKPECVIDFATLTGSAVRSLGTKFSAGFTNRKELHSKIIEAGVQSGERVWTFPLDKTYFKALESQVADTLQCTKGPGPDHIYAACFLSKFLKEGVAWVHVDLAASENSGGLAHVDSLFTGFGVRWLHTFLEAGV